MTIDNLSIVFRGADSIIRPTMNGKIEVYYLFQAASVTIVNDQISFNVRISYTPVDSNMSTEETTQHISAPIGQDLVEVEGANRLEVFMFLIKDTFQKELIDRGFFGFSDFVEYEPLQTA